MNLSNVVNPCCEIELGPTRLNSLGPIGCKIVAEAIIDGERWVTIVTFDRRLYWFSDQNKSDYYVHGNLTPLMLSVVDMKEKLYIMYVLAWA